MPGSDPLKSGIDSRESGAAKDRDADKPGAVIYTNKARCRDCYRCVRVCPVKAIRMHDGQAYVEPDRCIACGTCIRECPQGAKAFRDDVAEVERLLASGAPVAASLAPSFASVWPAWKQRLLPSALRRLGFSYVGETAIGAYFVSRETARVVADQPAGKHVCSACPAVVEYVTRYAPQFTDTLVPVVSPMIAHARHIKAVRGAQWKVVFIGPCTAKKAEAEWPEYAGVVDAVLTFRELLAWFETRHVDLVQCEESGFDESPGGAARYYPVPGGLLRTAGLDTDLLDRRHTTLSGVEDLAASLDGLSSHEGAEIIEPLFCRQGCVSGAGMPEEGNAFAARADVIEYAVSSHEVPGAEEVPQADLRTSFAGHYAQRPAFTDKEIADEMARLGKTEPEDQLDCGACGYSSCREKAIANLSGMAEPEMCVPQMRRLAEQRSDRIIDTSPNGIVILDEHLHILGMNPAFQKMFYCTAAVLDKPVAYLIDPAPFERVASREMERFESVVRYDNYSLVCHVLLYPLREERQYVGIFVNITKSSANEELLLRLRSRTVTQAQELLEHQISMAQQLAQFLGESTARGEVLVQSLMELAKSSVPQRPGDTAGPVQPAKSR